MFARPLSPTRDTADNLMEAGRKGPSPPDNLSERSRKGPVDIQPGNLRVSESNKGPSGGPPDNLRTGMNEKGPNFLESPPDNLRNRDSKGPTNYGSGPDQLREHSAVFAESLKGRVNPLPLIPRDNPAALRQRPYYSPYPSRQRLRNSKYSSSDPTEYKSTMNSRLGPESPRRRIAPGRLRQPKGG